MSQDQSYVPSPSKLTVEEPASLCLQNVSETEPRHLNSSYSRIIPQHNKGKWYIGSRNLTIFITYPTLFVPIVNFPSLTQTTRLTYTRVQKKTLAKSQISQFIRSKHRWSS